MPPDQSGFPAATQPDAGYRTALTDWLACAIGGREEPAARAARALGDGLTERVAAAATAGHVLDYDDTYLPGLAHLSAPTAPVAMVLGADLGATVGEALAAFAAGFEAMGALSAANHPALYERGWHPTAVCGVVGAAVTASRLLGLDPDGERTAARLALLRAGGLRGAFGSDGKSLQVGMAAAEGVLAARLVSAGAQVPADVLTGAAGFEAVYGARWADPGPRRAIDENWIKAYPCCLQTHSAIEAADRARSDGVPLDRPLTVTVHPVSLQAAAVTEPRDGLEAKFSIPYLVAFTILHGPPRVQSFGAIDERARDLAADRVAVRTDAALLESEAVLCVDGHELSRVEAALGSPQRPMSDEQLSDKVTSLAGDRIRGTLDEPSRPVADTLALAAIGVIP